MPSTQETAGGRGPAGEDAEARPIGEFRQRRAMTKLNGLRDDYWRAVLLDPGWEDLQDVRREIESALHVLWHDPLTGPGSKPAYRLVGAKIDRYRRLLGARAARHVTYDRFSDWMISGSKVFRMLYTGGLPPNPDLAGRGRPGEPGGLDAAPGGAPDEPRAEGPPP